MVKVALFVRLEAKAGKESEVENFLKSGLPLVMEEPATIAWFGIRLGPTTFGIFDAFPDDAGRQAHLSGKVAAALMAKAGTCSPRRRSSRKSTCLQQSCPARRRRQPPSGGFVIVSGIGQERTSDTVAASFQITTARIGSRSRNSPVDNRSPACRSSR